MKKVNINDTKDKLLAYYGDEQAQQRTRNRIFKENLKTCITMIPVILLIALFFSMFMGIENIYTIAKYLLLLLGLPVIGSLIIEYIFVILEGSGYGISMGFGIIFLIINNFITPYKLATLITILLLFVFCLWYSNNRFSYVTDKARIELLQNDVNVEIINNKVIFK